MAGMYDYSTSIDNANGSRKMTIYIVIDSQNKILGAFANEADAQAAADAHAYFCTITPQQVK